MVLFGYLFDLLATFSNKENIVFVRTSIHPAVRYAISFEPIGEIQNYSHEWGVQQYFLAPPPGALGRDRSNIIRFQ